MNEQPTRPAHLALPLMGLLTLVVTSLIDYGLFRLRVQVGSTFSPHPLIAIGALSAAALVVAAFLAATAWVALRRRPTRPAGLLLLLLGLPVALLPLLFTLGLLSWGLNTAAYLTGEHLRLAGAFLTMLALIVLFRPQHGGNDE